MLEVQDVCDATAEIEKSTASIEKSNKSLLVTLNEKVEETIGDLGNVEKTFFAENSDLSIQLEHLESQANFLKNYKNQLQTDLEEARRIADNEAKERSHFSIKLTDSLVSDLNFLSQAKTLIIGV